jgi:hypothetical protein
MSESSRPTWIQLWVERLEMDPAAWTAGHTLQLLLGGDAPARVGRADLWELSVLGTTDDVSERFETWMRASNLFMNPSRDRGVLLGDVAPVPNEASALVVTVDRGSGESRAHALTLGHALGGKWHVRRGTVWTLVWPIERASDVPLLADRAAFARRRQSGLLVNPESQDARVLVGEWVCPVLPGAEDPVLPAAKGPAPPGADEVHGGAHGGVA